MLEGALDSIVRAARDLVCKLHLNWGHASASQLQRISVSWVNVSKVVPDAADDAVSQCETYQALDNATYVTIAGTLLALAFNENAKTEPRSDTPSRWHQAKNSVGVMRWPPPAQ